MINKTLGSLPIFTTMKKASLSQSIQENETRGRQLTLKSTSILYLIKEAEYKVSW